MQALMHAHVRKEDKEKHERDLCIRQNRDHNNAALTHTSRPYCDLKTSKIAFFLSKLVWFSFKFPNFSRRRSGALQSCVQSMSSIRPFYVHGVSTATILRPQGDPMAIIGDPDATVLRSLRPYGDSTATIAFVRRLSCDCTTSKDVVRTW